MKIGRSADQAGLRWSVACISLASLLLHAAGGDALAVGWTGAVLIWLWLGPSHRSLSPARNFSAASLLVVAILSVCISLLIPLPRSGVFDPTIQTRVLSASEEGKEVWVRVTDEDGTEIKPSRAHGSWLYKDGWQVSTGPGASLIFESKISSWATLAFVAHEWSGVVRVNGSDIVLERPRGASETIGLPVVQIGSGASRLVLLVALIKLLDTLLVGALVMLAINGRQTEGNHAET